jgi:hypothetical protein
MAQNPFPWPNPRDNMAVDINAHTRTVAWVCPSCRDRSTPIEYANTRSTFELTALVDTWHAHLERGHSISGPCRRFVVVEDKSYWCTLTADHVRSFDTNSRDLVRKPSTPHHFDFHVSDINPSTQGAGSCSSDADPG